MEKRMLSVQVPADLADELQRAGRALGLKSDRIVADALQDWLEKNDMPISIAAMRFSQAPVQIERHRAIDWAESF